MSQHDYEITNADANTGINVRAAINAALQALASNNSGATEPPTPYAYMMWADTTTGLLKQRNAANTAWITIGTLASTNLGIEGTLIKNLKPSVNANANKLDIFTKTGGGVPDANNSIMIAVPDGNGYSIRSRAAAYLSGASQFVLADATGYWGYTSLVGSQYPLYLYAIWDGTGIVWTASACPTLEMVTTTTTNTDPNYMLLEDGSTYTRNAGHFCQLVGWGEAEYSTADTPDWTIIPGSCGVGTVAPRWLTDIGKTRIDFSGKAKPGEIEIDGSSLLRTTYARLFTHYGGAIYGSADGTHFNLPKPSGRALRIWDHGAGVDPDAATRTDRGDGTTGDYVGTKQAGGNASHNHSIMTRFYNNYPYGATGGGGWNTDTSTTTGSSGGLEARMTNINVGLYVRAY